eukprot:m.425851 g.425851  ORF g.425851 m.425851 type:complete len:136 (+) comp21349_c0_seq1:590-997(+)
MEMKSLLWMCVRTVRSDKKMAFESVLLKMQSSTCVHDRGCSPPGSAIPTICNTYIANPRVISDLPLQKPCVKQALSCPHRPVYSIEAVCAGLGTGTRHSNGDGSHSPYRTLQSAALVMVMVPPLWMLQSPGPGTT